MQAWMIISQMSTISSMPLASPSDAMICRLLRSYLGVSPCISEINSGMKKLGIRRGMGPSVVRCRIFAEPANMPTD